MVITPPSTSWYDMCMFWPFNQSLTATNFGTDICCVACAWGAAPGGCGCMKKCAWLVRITGLNGRFVAALLGAVVWELSPLCSVKAPPDGPTLARRIASRRGSLGLG